MVLLAWAACSNNHMTHSCLVWPARPLHFSPPSPTHPKTEYSVCSRCFSSEADKEIHSSIQSTTDSVAGHFNYTEEAERGDLNTVCAAGLAGSGLDGCRAALSVSSSRHGECPPDDWERRSLALTQQCPAA